MRIWRQSWAWGREYFRHVRPDVVRGLSPLRARAESIPDPTLRDHALSSLNTKQFHCEGGGVFSGPSRDPEGHLLDFLLPYQTLCDYLDTVTDRGPSQDPDDLRQLHLALIDAVNPDNPLRDYYALHPHQADGGYLVSLVEDARHGLSKFPGFHGVHPAMNRLVELYVDLQVYKHGPLDQRVARLAGWFDSQPETIRDSLAWWEFAAATGSTLGLFALLNLARNPEPTPDRVNNITRLYFPWMGALHILLDYYVDQEEDRLGGDLNFITYYPSPARAIAAIQRIYRRVMTLAGGLEDAAFHQYIARGLLGFYLSDRKVRSQTASCRLLASGGPVSVGIYMAALVGRSP